MDKQNLVMNGQPDNAKTCLVSFKYFEFRTVQKLSCDSDKKKKTLKKDIVEKGENTSYQHFLFLLQCFSSQSPTPI